MTTLSAQFLATYGATFRQTHEQAYREVTEREQQKSRSPAKDFNFLRANLGHFCPDLPTEQHEAIYLRVLTNHWLSARSFRYVDYGSLAHMSVAGETDFLQPTAAKRPPRIFCTYHLGGYRGILMMLLNAGYPLTLVIDSRTLHSQKDYIEGVTAQLRAYNPEAPSIELLDAETPAIGQQMVRATQQGRSILIFLDGNTGVGGIYQRNSRQLRIPFLGVTIVSRTGIAMLAQATRTPIQPIISYYQTVDGIELPYYVCPPTITFRSDMATTFVQQATQQLYDILADYVRRYPDQWESWFYFHKFLDVDSLSPAPNADPFPEDGLPPMVGFNEQRYSLFRIAQVGYLFDRHTYQTYPLPDDGYAWLHRLQQTTAADEMAAVPSIDKALLMQCWQMSALQAV